MQKEQVTGRKNFTFHRQTTHPLVSKKGSTMVPGWNASNDEITASGRHGCYVLFDKWKAPVRPMSRCPSPSRSAAATP